MRAVLWPLVVAGLDTATVAVVGGRAPDLLEVEFAPDVLLAEMQAAAAQPL